MAAGRRRDIQYWFPVISPVLAALCNLGIRSIGQVPTWEAVVVEFPMVVIYACFTIDIWGIATAADAFPTSPAITRIWLVLLITHLLLFVGAVIVEHHVSRTFEPVAFLLMLNSILSLVALALVLWGRDKLWLSRSPDIAHQ